MMALLYAVQGSFWPLLAVHLADLGIQGPARGWIFATLAIGSLAVPLGAGQLVDRFLPTQWFLALTYALGTGLLVFMALGFAGTSGFDFRAVSRLLVADRLVVQLVELAGDAQTSIIRPANLGGCVSGELAAGWSRAGPYRW